AGNRVADNDASQLTFLPRRVGEGRADVDGVVAPDEEGTGLTELRPRGNEPAVLIEYLNAVVLSIGDVHPAARAADEKVMWLVEFAGRRSHAAPRLDEAPVARKLHDASSAVLVRRVTIRDEYVAVWRHGNARRPIE